MTRQTDQDHVWELIEGIGLCMFVSHDGAGDQLRARPMSAHARRDEDAIYFLTDRRSHKDAEVEINENVCLTFADNGAYKYVSVTGTANVLVDRARTTSSGRPLPAPSGRARTIPISGSCGYGRRWPSSGTARARSSPASRWWRPR